MNPVLKMCLDPSGNLPFGYKENARGVYRGGPQLDTFRGDYSLLGFNSKMVAPLPGFSRLMHSGPPSPPG